MSSLQNIVRQSYLTGKAFGRALCWRMLGPEIVLSSGLRVAIQAESEWVIATEIFINREYDEGIQLAFGGASSKRPLRVLDLGANVGFFSLRCLHFHREMTPDTGLDLMAVEGSSTVFVALQKRYAAPLDPKVKVSVKSGLIGKRTGKEMFYSPIFSSHTGTVTHDKNTSSIRVMNSYAEEREYLDLEELLDRRWTIDLIKCDIEGSELDFLRSYPDLLRRTRVLVIELHPKRCDVAACREILASYGFLQERVVKTCPDFFLELYRSSAGSDDLP